MLRTAIHSTTRIISPYMHTLLHTSPTKQACLFMIYTISMRTSSFRSCFKVINLHQAEQDRQHIINLLLVLFSILHDLHICFLLLFCFFSLLHCWRFFFVAFIWFVLLRFDSVVIVLIYLCQHRTFELEYAALVVAKRIKNNSFRYIAK